MLPLALFLSYLISSALVLPQPIAQINSQNIMYFLQENKISENKINSKMGKFRKIYPHLPKNLSITCLKK